MRRSATRRWWADALALGGVGLAFVIRHLLSRAVADLPPFITLYPTVALVAILAGARAGILATALSLAVAGYLQMGPGSEPAHGLPWVAVSLGAFGFAGFLISALAGRVDRARRHEATALERERAREEVVRTAAETERQRRLLEVTLQSIGDAVIVTDPGGSVTFLNPEAERLTGWPTAEAAGRPLVEVFDIVNAETGQAVESPVTRVLNTGRVVGLANHTVLRSRDGRETPIDDSAAPIRHRDGELEGVVLVFRDFTERQRDANALREGAARLRAVGDNLPGGAIYQHLRHPDGRASYAYMSAGIRRILGVTAEEVMADPDSLRRLTLGEDRERVSAAEDASARTLTPFVCEFRQRTVAGEVRWVHCRSTPRRLADGSVLWDGVVTDDTERKLAEQRHEAGEQRLRLALDAAQAGTWEADLPSGPFSWSDRVWTLLNLDPSGPPPSYEAWLGAVHPEDRPGVERAMTRAQREGTGIDVEYRVPGRAGTPERWVTTVGRAVKDASGRVVRFNGIAADVTERKRGEADLRRSVRRLRTIFDGMADALYILAADARILEVNRSACESLAYPCDELVGRSVTEIDARLSRGEIDAIMETAHAAPGTPVTFETEHRRSDGSVYPVEIRALEVDWEGEPRVLALARDATDRKQAEAAVRESHDRLKKVLEVETVGLIFWDLSTGRMTDANDAFLRLMGYDRRDVESGALTWQSLTPPEYLEVSRAEVRKFMESGRVGPYEKEYFCKDGTRRWLVFAGSSLGGNACVEFCVDIADRKKAEAALRVSEERLRLALDAARAGVWEWDPLTDENVWSDELWPLFGLEPGSRRPSFEAWLETIHPDDRDRAERVARQAVAGGLDYSSEWRVRGGEGPDRWLMARGRPGGDGSGANARYFGIVLDITERKRAEAALEQTRNTLAEAQKIAQLGSFEYLAASRAMAWSEEEYRIFGLDPAGPAPTYDDLLARNVHPDDAVPLDVCFNGAIRSFADYEFEYRIVRADGVVRWVHDRAYPYLNGQGELVRYVGTTQDVTDRRLAEEALHALNADLERRVAERTADVHKLAQIIDSSTDFVGTATPEGRSLWRNASYRRVLGEDAAGAPRRELIAEVHPPDEVRTVFSEGIPAAVRDGHWEGENAVLAADGRVIPVSQLILAHRGDDGRVAFLSTIMRDITERKRLEADLRERSVELARASRLKDEFLASMSHELRTPLNAVLGLSQALVEGVYGAVTHRQAEVVGDIERSGRHLLGLINDILDLSKVEAGHLRLRPAPTAVESVCQASVRLVRQAAMAKRLRLSSTLDDGLGPVVADELRLKQILVNLLSNAVKFTPEGGEVVLEVRGDRKAATLTFAVRDTGIGIRPEDMRILFQPFRQIDSRLSREYSGTGLGLALVRRLAELHGGTAAAESEPGKGSRFTVTIPWVPYEEPGASGAAPETPTPPTVESAGAGTDPGPAARGPLVLIAEDDESSASMTADVLAAAGYRVARAGDGEQALRLAAELNPDLILMDVQMPQVDGLEAIRRLRADPRTRATPVIAITALAMSGDQEKCLAAGADTYLSKPFDLRELRRLLKEFTRTRPADHPHTPPNGGA